MRLGRLKELDLGSFNTHLGLCLGGGLAVVLAAVGLSHELGAWLWVVLVLGVLGTLAGLLGLALDGWRAWGSKKPARPLAQVKREGLALHRDYLQEIADRTNGEPQDQANLSEEDSYKLWARRVKYSQESLIRLQQRFALSIISLHADLAAYGHRDPELDRKMKNSGHFMRAESWMRELVVRISVLCERVPD